LKQQLARGLPGYELDFWTENGIQDFKSLVKYRGTHDPEIIGVNSLMVRHALAKMKRDFGYHDGKPYLQTVHERVPKMRAGDRVLRISDDGDASTGSQLLGLGTEASVLESSDIVSSINQAVAESEDMWKFPLHAVEACNFTIYRRAHLRGVEVLLSESYEAIKSRFSHFALAEWEGQATYIVKILYFVKVESPHDDSYVTASTDGAMRFAVCHLYNQCELSTATGSCHRVTRQQQSKPAYQHYAVDLEVLNCKVMWGEVANIKVVRDKRDNITSPHGFPDGAWYFVKYPNGKCYMQADATDIVDYTAEEVDLDTSTKADV